MADEEPKDSANLTGQFYGYGKREEKTVRCMIGIRKHGFCVLLNSCMSKHRAGIESRFWIQLAVHRNYRDHVR